MNKEKLERLERWRKNNCALKYINNEVYDMLGELLKEVKEDVG